MGWFNDIRSIFFPKRCFACESVLHSGQEAICADCRSHMPFTFYWMIKDNYLTDLFAGRMLLDGASALFYYEHGSQYREMIHDMKYRSAYEVADVLGQIYGYYIAQSPYFKGIDLIIPVPLHRKRLLSRGFNQSEVFARGIEKQCDLQVETKALKRVKNTDKQATKKDAHQRWENVEDAFELKRPDLLAGKKIMIVDDVITTGSTIEACTRAINAKLPDVRFYVGAMACVKKRLK